MSRSYIICLIQTFFLFNKNTVHVHLFTYAKFLISAVLIMENEYVHLGNRNYKHDFIQPD